MAVFSVTALFNVNVFLILDFLIKVVIVRRRMTTENGVETLKFRTVKVSFQDQSKFHLVVGGGELDE